MDPKLVSFKFVAGWWEITGMKKFVIAGALIGAAASGAWAAGVERTTFNSGLLFEEGDYLELSFGVAMPDVSGSGNGPFTGTTSGDMAKDYFSIGLGYKQQLNDPWALALIIDQPVGADVSYPAGTYPFQDSTANVESKAITALAKYSAANNLSFYGGIKAQQLSGNVSIPFFTGYTLTTDKSEEFGYVLGAAWEKPEIAARVSLTYSSEITHTFNSVEGGVFPGTFDTTIPQSLQLDFRTGVAADTLVFGSVRWVDWTEFQILPPAFSIASGGLPLAAYDSDYITYSLGVGRRFNETWSGAITLTHEPSSGDLMRNLGPTDGFSSVGVGATYTNGNMKITGGVRYALIGDATTTTVGSTFEGNKAIGAGVKIGWSF